MAVLLHSCAGGAVPLRHRCAGGAVPQAHAVPPAELCGMAWAAADGSAVAKPATGPVAAVQPAPLTGICSRLFLIKSLRCKDSYPAPLKTWAI